MKIISKDLLVKQRFLKINSKQFMNKIQFVFVKLQQQMNLCFLQLKESQNRMFSTNIILDMREISIKILSNRCDNDIQSKNQ
jgi:hypothetical protein